jgi:hypothetical protein
MRYHFKERIMADRFIKITHNDITTYIDICEIFAVFEVIYRGNKHASIDINGAQFSECDSSLRIMLLDESRSYNEFIGAIIPYIPKYLITADPDDGLDIFINKNNVSRFKKTQYGENLLNIFSKNGSVVVAKMSIEEAVEILNR